MVAQAHVRAASEPSLAGPLLSVRGVSVRFGGIVALDGVSFDVAPGRIAGLIGPNGAGKTTLFNCLSRLYVPDEGDILFEGRSILDRPRHAIPKLGIGRTFQNVALFDRMSVLDNIKVGCHSRTSTGFLTNALRLPRSEPEERRITERAEELVAFMDLAAFAPRPATPSCCCSTSRRPASTTTRSMCCAARSGACATPSRSPCCWWSTT
jgi:branched-chain amino acid transport system ATP-binding protein